MKMIIMVKMMIIIKLMLLISELTILTITKAHKDKSQINEKYTDGGSLTFISLSKTQVTDPTPKPPLRASRDTALALE